MTANLVCPMCGSYGKIIHDEIFGFGAECTNPKCQFKIEYQYKYPDGAYNRWVEAYEYIIKKEESINRSRPLSWRTTFPRKEGKYLIYLSNGGIIIRRIGKLNGKWSTCYGPLSNLQGVLFYGPIPDPEFKK